MRRLPFVIGVFLFSLLVLAPTYRVHADSPTPTPNSSDSQDELRKRISELESTISDLKGKERSLSSDISVMDNKMQLTTLRIARTKRQIGDVELSIETTANKISNLESSLDKTIPVVLDRIVATYKSGSFRPLQILLASNNLTDLLKKENYLKIVQTHDRELLFAVQNSKMNFAEQKKTLEAKQSELKELNGELIAQNKDLEVQQRAKKQLLTQTQGSESNYQRLLSQAKAQLAGFSNFVSNQGGASLLSNQTSCNDWGCYYNQRDTQWGGLALNGTKYTIASDGCLVTSMAMVMTHYGRKTTPADINANSDNFASYYPAYLLYTITANGATAERIGASIDSTLATNNPVIVGVHAYGGTHFVVLASGSGGNYKMYDPYIENGHEISFSEHYSTSSIFEVDKVIIH